LNTIASLANEIGKASSRRGWIHVATPTVSNSALWKVTATELICLPFFQPLKIFLKVCRRNSKLYKLLVDTNIFDHIYNNNLAAKVKNFVDNGIISVFAISVQWDELEGMSDIKVKSAIENMMRQTLSLS
jgi:hypothetical protein